MDNVTLFEKNKYVLLKDFLARENCDQLTSALMSLVHGDETVNDIQCPSSEAIHGAAVFDKLLEDLLPYFEQACGKRLLPTYSYARLYKPGEILSNHTDRESCEISATLTIGFEGESWPIFMGSEDKSDSSKIAMGVGDAVLYRGMEKHHWREVYDTGLWQAQVFLHYVDAAGPHKEWIYDKRPALGSAKQSESSEMLYWFYDDILPGYGCDIVVETYTKNNVDRMAPYIGYGEGRIDTTIRNVERVEIPVYKDTGARLVAAGLDANSKNWKFDITHANQAEFLIYPSDGRYTTHSDTFLHSGDKECRKITVLAFLNDDYEGGRFYLVHGNSRIYPPQKKGTILAFPSFIPHGVEDVTSGTRYSAVCWMVGPWFV